MSITDRSKPINLGAKYRDSLTGLEGVAVARVEYLTGCVQIGLTFLKDGVPHTEYLDDMRLTDVPLGGAGGPSIPIPSRPHP